MSSSNYAKYSGLAGSGGGGGGSGTVTSVSVVSTNGFAGTVANATTTPAITIKTTITGILKGNGTAISEATAGTDYVIPSVTSLPDLSAIGTQSQDLNMGSFNIDALKDPTTAQQAATKNYVDTIASSLQPIQAVTYASASTNYPGTMVGNVLTITATGAISIDGNTPSANQRVLLKDQSTQSQNGVYVVTVIGTTGVSPVLTRASDYNTAADVNAGDLIPVLSGTVNTNTSWLQTATVTTINSDPLVFAEWTANPANYLLKSNNLSDVANAATAFANIQQSSLSVTNGTVTLAQLAQTSGAWAALGAF